MKNCVLYRFACDENGQIISINDITIGNRVNKTYKCISCGAEMIARLGDINTHHFSHKKDCVCNGETYLHKLAKKLIKQKFDTSDEFWVYLKQKKFCNLYDRCNYFDSEVCYDAPNYKKYNLKEFYDLCKEEFVIGNFIADLLIKNSEKDNRQPLLIEFKVSHSCSENKLNSGYKIIEIPIKSEDDITNLYNSKEWVYTNNNIYRGFDEEIIGEKPLNKRTFLRVILYKNGRISRPVEVECIKGKSPHTKTELNLTRQHSYYKDLDTLAIASLLSQGESINSCILCKNYVEEKGSCRISKSHGTDKEPKLSNAIFCRYYCIDEERADKLKESVSSLGINKVE